MYEEGMQKDSGGFRCLFYMFILRLFFHYTYYTEHAN